MKNMFNKFVEGFVESIYVSIVLVFALCLLNLIWGILKEL